MINEDDQDEDITIGLLPISMLVPLIADSACPKAQVVLQCLDASLRRAVLKGEECHLERVRDAAKLASNYDDTGIRDWSALLSRRLEFRAGVGRVDEKLANEMGEALLNGVGHTRQLNILTTIWGEFVVRPTSETGTIRERLTISGRTGRFRYSLRLSSGKRLH